MQFNQDRETLTTLINRYGQSYSQGTNNYNGATSKLSELNSLTRF